MEICVDNHQFAHTAYFICCMISQTVTSFLLFFISFQRNDLIVSVYYKIKARFATNFSISACIFEKGKH